VEVGSLVIYRNNGTNRVPGIVIKSKGKLWVVVQWSDGVVLSEHVSDLKKLEKTS
jgi:hypothetical protein|tara:strand:+ start:179 stop:343 length:165 start_codon:yes stop_codon:yes gene_type:complete